MFEFVPSFFCELNCLANLEMSPERKERFCKKLLTHYTNEEVANFTESTVFIRDCFFRRRGIHNKKYAIIDTFSSPLEANKFIELCQKKIEIINKNHLLKRFGKKYQIGKSAIGQSDEVLTCADTYILKTKDFQNKIEW
jgi:hypothetical protein